MRMRRPEAALVGPKRATPEDVVPLNRLFADAFTERYHRDGLVGVRVPQLNPDVWRYSLRDAGDGAMLWYDEEGELVAFNLAHRSGVEGWMGPLAVRTERQERGLGRTIVTTAIEWLSAAGATVIGLETMPRTVDNIGFYSRLGFHPHHLTITLTGEAGRLEPAADAVRLSAVTAGTRADLIDACRERLDRSAAGYDYGREMALTAEMNLGDTVVVHRGSTVEAFAVCHTAALASGRGAEELRVLKLFAASQDAFLSLMGCVETIADDAMLSRVAIRCQTGQRQAYRALIDRGYDVRWTDLRMTLHGRPETHVPAGEVLFSNWEI
jgi:GNAT superfamily N-acetyltransferase